MIQHLDDDRTLSSKSTSAFAPLAYPVFRWLWIASVVSNIGTWIQNVGAAWLMTELTTSPLLVSLIQAATTLPIFLLGLPAGALADIVDRRWLLIIAQAWMGIAAGLLAFFTMANVMSPWLLLGLTFALGLGFAMNAPAWQAIIPELVPRSELQSAVNLNGVSLNASRAVGPAIGGMIVTAAGPVAAFLLNAVSFVAVIFVLYRWDRVPERRTLPAERLIGATRAGIRYVLHAPSVHSVLVRTIAFIIGASGLWALLPAITRSDPSRGPGDYGLLLGCLGIGAIIGTFMLTSIRRSWGMSEVTLGGSLIYAVSTGLIACTSSFLLWCLLLIPAGAGWLAVLTSMSGSVQILVPSWVRARVIAVYLLAFYGGLAAGSIAWGVVADHWGIRLALGLSALWTGAGLFTGLYFRLPEGAPPNLEPSHHWPEAPAVPDPNLEKGPVLVTVEYSIKIDVVHEFLQAAEALRHVRLRDGGLHWDLFEDASLPGRFVEVFSVESWAEHLRQHDRVTNEDRAIEATIIAFHSGPERPKVTHLIAAWPPNVASLW